MGSEESLYFICPMRIPPVYKGTAWTKSIMLSISQKVANATEYLEKVWYIISNKKLEDTGGTENEEICLRTLRL